jgi:excisionase family DNA binding protein
MDDNASDVLTARETAAMLRVSPDTLRSMTAAGKIPGRMVGRRYRYSRKAVYEWLSRASPAVPVARTTRTPSRRAFEPQVPNQLGGRI